MGDVIDINPVGTWHCVCGCSTFHLYNDDTIKCAFCGTHSDADGNWRHRLTESPIEGDLPDIIIQNSVGDLCRQRVSKQVIAQDCIGAVNLFKDGRVSTWSTVEDFQTDERSEWLREMLASAFKLITNGRELDDRKTGGG